MGQGELGSSGLLEIGRARTFSGEENRLIVERGGRATSLNKFDALVRDECDSSSMGVSSSADRQIQDDLMGLLVRTEGQLIRV